jgi:hypothetical protein
MPVVGEMWHSRAKEVAESRQGVLGVANVLVQALARLREALIRGLGLKTLPPIVDLVGQYRHRLAGEDATGRRDAPPAAPLHVDPPEKSPALARDSDPPRDALPSRILNP